MKIATATEYIASLQNHFQLHKMINYIKAFAVMVALNLGGLFGLGFCVGVLMAITGNANAANNMEQFAWFNILVLLCWFPISFFAFKFSVDKFFKK